ncbi:hypothetical protein [Pseudorhodobacter sp.]|uniref:hypothetical protein n=1 Tax=Pseudorhodobacter sp. TaxID=1934400 RepID=UPI002648C0E7|nr:hypothetical protein [Pseudorhodobacter sp.]
MMNSTAAVAFLALFTCAATAQTVPPSDFTTPEGAAFIHQQLGDQLLAFKQEGAQDLIYFTTLLSWRCGVQELYYGFNDDLAVTRFPMEPCYRDLRQPNTNKEIGTIYPFFISVPTGSVAKVSLRVIYEDGSTAKFLSERAKNLVY